MVGRALDEVRRKLGPELRKLSVKCLLDVFLVEPVHRRIETGHSHRTVWLDALCSEVKVMECKLRLEGGDTDSDFFVCCSFFVGS